MSIEEYIKAHVASLRASVERPYFAQMIHALSEAYVAGGGSSALPREPLSLCAAHGLILSAFGRCADGNLSAGAQFSQKVADLSRISKQFNDAYGERYPERDGGEEAT